MANRPPEDELVALYDAVIVKIGVTTAPGAAAGNSIIDLSLAGSGVGSFSSMGMVLYPGDTPRVDSMGTTGFNNVTGEVTLSRAYKGIAAAIPAGVPYIMVSSGGGGGLTIAQAAQLLAIYTRIGDPTGDFLNTIVTKLGNPAVNIATMLSGVLWGVLTAPTAVEPDTFATLGLSITTVAGIPLAGTITPGALAIYRIRAGASALIVNAPCLAADGLAYYDYTFPSAGAVWQPGDEYEVIFAGQAFTITGVTFHLSNTVAHGRITREGQIENQVAKLAGSAPTSGSQIGNWNGGGVGGTQICTIGAAGVRNKVHSLIIDISALGGNITPMLFINVNGALKKIFPPKPLTFSIAGGDAPGIAIINGTFGIANQLIVSAYSDAPGDDGTAIGFEYFLEPM